MIVLSGEWSFGFALDNYKCNGNRTKIGELLYRAKYAEQKDNPDILGLLMTEEIKKSQIIRSPPKGIIAPKGKLSISLAKRISKFSGIPFESVVPRINRKTKDIHPNERNICFNSDIKINSDWNKILIIDDILQTGSTIKAIIKALPKNIITIVCVACYDDPINWTPYLGKQQIMND